jgi:soluble lytic murein transglycosylase-like protein
VKNAGVRGWLDEMSKRLAPKVPDGQSRDEFMATVHYESARAGLDPQLVLGVIQLESNFRKYAISSADARATCR